VNQTLEHASPELFEGTKEEVLKALENPKYVWRTTHGISSDTKLPEDTVAAALSRLSPDILVTTVGRQGRLYTTRDHYDKTQSFWGKLLSAVSGTLK
jgi:hypothetical protein